MKAVPKPSITELWEHYGGTFQGGDRGGWRKATCVIHEDGSPSASVNEDECRWRCFVCDESGDAIDLVMRVENVGWNAAKQICEARTDGSSGSVLQSSGGSSLVPGRQRRDGRSGGYKPPWLR